MPVRLVLLVVTLLAPFRASAQDRTRDWQADLDTALTVFLPKDHAFGLAEREAFTLVVTGLRDSVAHLSDEEVVVRLARAVALAANAHTRVYLLRNASYLRRYPIRLWWFGDSLYVVRARPEDADLLGARVTGIAGRTVDEAAAAVAPLFAGNGGWRRYMATYTLTSPDVLLGLGLVRGGGATPFTFETADGRLVERALDPLPLQRHSEPTEA
ncbi:MAG TPA: hypothetical protein VGB53_01195 [Rubricoccaceae bacterium]|jgi:hypothetical protein